MNPRHLKTMLISMAILAAIVLFILAGGNALFP